MALLQPKKYKCDLVHKLKAVRFGGGAEKRAIHECKAKQFGIDDT